MEGVSNGPGKTDNAPSRGTALGPRHWAQGAYVEPFLAARRADRNLGVKNVLAHGWPGSGARAVGRRAR